MSEKGLIKESGGSEIVTLKGGAYQPGLSFREYRFLERTLDTDLPVVNCSTLKAETTIDMHALVHPDPEEEEKKERQVRPDRIFYPTTLPSIPPFVKLTTLLLDRRK